MQPMHGMPVVIKIIAQLLYDNNLQINKYIFLGSEWLLVLTTLQACVLVSLWIVAVKLLP